MSPLSPVLISLRPSKIFQVLRWIVALFLVGYLFLPSGDPEFDHAATTCSPPLSPPLPLRSSSSPSSPPPFPSSRFLSIFTILAESNSVNSGVIKEAVSSWIALNQTHLVILFGELDSCQQILNDDWKGKVLCAKPYCVEKRSNIHTLNSIFTQAKELANAKYLMYIDPTVQLSSNPLEAITFAEKKFERFFIVGGPSTEGKNSTHSERITYFVSPTEQLVLSPPSFLVGFDGWINWVVAQHLRLRGMALIDASEVIHTKDLIKESQGSNQRKSKDPRISLDHNIRLARTAGFVDTRYVGNLNSCDHRITPLKNDGCPLCRLEKVAQPLDVMLYKHHTNKDIMVATVDAGYIGFALNWACSLKRLGVENFFFHATDDEVFKELFERSMPVVKYLSVLSQEYEKIQQDAVVYGSVSYQSLMNTRTSFVTMIVERGYNVLLSDIDIVYLKNPFPYLDPELDLQGGAHKTEKITGGFIYTRSTGPSLHIWSKVLKEHDELFLNIQKKNSFGIHSNTEQELLNRALLSSAGTISWGRVPPSVIADGDFFFINKTTQKNGIWPAAIHNNYVYGGDNKRQRFVNTSLWLIDEEDEMKCKSMVPPPPGYPGSRQPTVAIKILTFDRPRALERLLKSLEDAEYPTEDSISLEIFIDYPKKESVKDQETLENRNECIKLAASFEWKQGQKNVVVRSKHFGLAGQWVNSWTPQSPTEVGFILEDDNVVSPHYYTWLKQALGHYFHDSSQYDPHLAGIAFQNQHVIAGHYSKRPGNLLPKGTHLYRYQLPSTWGPVFFANHWSGFVAWYKERSANKKFQPFFSNLITNDWFKSRGGGQSVWSAWFIRFCAERGYYMLYTNFEGGEALVVNMRETGVNYKDSKGANSLMVMSLSSKMLTFPPVDEIPIYDFHFNHITEGAHILEGRAIYADIFNIQTY